MDGLTQRITAKKETELSLSGVKVLKHLPRQVVIPIDGYAEVDGEDFPTITLNEPTLAQMGIAQSNELKIRIDYPDIDAETAYHVSLFTMIHALPEATNLEEIRQFYIGVALENAPLMSLLRARFYTEYAWIRDVMGVAIERKK